MNYTYIGSLLMPSTAVSALLGATNGCAPISISAGNSASASAAVPANIAEGFGQQTDRHFAKYLFIARGSSNEVRAHLAWRTAEDTWSDRTRLTSSGKYEEIARMLTGLIKYLRACDRKRARLANCPILDCQLPTSTAARLPSCRLGLPTADWDCRLLDCRLGLPTA